VFGPAGGASELRTATDVLVIFFEYVPPSIFSCKQDLTRHPTAC
jgi:hypothetical protein